MADIKPSSGRYARYREDGWPYCPQCGEDELWSAADPASIETIHSCLRCGWWPGISNVSMEDIITTDEMKAAYGALRARHGG